MVVGGSHIGGLYFVKEHTTHNFEYNLHKG